MKVQDDNAIIALVDTVTKSISILRYLEETANEEGLSWIIGGVITDLHNAYMQLESLPNAPEQSPI